MGAENTAGATDRYYHGRIADVSFTSAAGRTYICVATRCQIERILVAFDVDPVADWIATVSSPLGVLATSGLDLGDAGGHATIANDQVVDFDVDRNDPNNVFNPGDVIDIQTTTGSGASGSAFFAVVVRA